MTLYIKMKCELILFSHIVETKVNVKSNTLQMTLVAIIDLTFLYLIQFSLGLKYTVLTKPTC